MLLRDHSIIPISHGITILYHSYNTESEPVSRKKGKNSSGMISYPEEI